MINKESKNEEKLDLTQLSDDALMKLKPEDVQIVPKKKLTKWKNEPSLEELKLDLKNTESSHSAFTSNLARWENLYNAPKYGAEGHKGSRIVPKMVRKQAEWRCPALSEPFLSTQQLFEVKPMTFEDVERAKQNNLILNMQFNTQLNKVTLVDKVVRAVVKDGTAVVRLGWEYKEEKVTEYIPQFQYMPAPPEIQEQLGQQYEQLAQLQQTEPDSYEQAPEELKAGFEMSQEQQQLLIAQPAGEVQQEVMKPVVNKPTIELCNIRNIRIDPTCNGDLDKAQFVIYSYESSLSELKKLGIYSDLEKLDNYEETNPVGFDKENNDFKFSDKARKKLVVYEYWGNWDVEDTGETKSIVAAWVGNTLIRMEENPFPDKKVPFVVFNYIPEEDSIFGIPDAELLEDNQAINGAVTRGMIDLMGKSANSQTGFSKGFLDSTNKIKFNRGENYEYNPNFNPNVHVHTHTYPEIPNSAITMVQMMNNEAESISGVKAFSGSQGINASYLGDTAAGARGVLDAVSKREMSILRRLSEGFVKIGRKIMSMNSEWLSEEEVVRVTNSEFIKVRRDDLIGQFDLSLGIATAEENDSKSKQLSFLLQTIGNNMGQEITQIILSQIAELGKMPDLAKQIKDYQPQPDPIQQKLQELELAYKEAEIELLKSQAAENMAKAQVQGAKVGVEQARAESLQGDADNKALDFAQKDSGVTHNRELEKQDLTNQSKMMQQQMQNEAASQQIADQHNANLLQQFATNELATPATNQSRQII